MEIIAIVATPSTCLLLGWLAYLRFAKWLVKQTGDAASLTHAARLTGFLRRRSMAPPTPKPDA